MATTRRRGGVVGAVLGGLLLLVVAVLGVGRSADADQVSDLLDVVLDPGAALGSIDLTSPKTCQQVADLVIGEDQVSLTLPELPIAETLTQAEVTAACGPTSWKITIEGATEFERDAGGAVQLDLALELTWPNGTDSIVPDLEVTAGLSAGETLTSVADALAVLGAFSSSSLPPGDRIPPGLDLDALALRFAYDHDAGDVDLDVISTATLTDSQLVGAPLPTDEVQVRLLLAVQDRPGADPALLTAVRLDSTDPEKDNITLNGLLGSAGGTLAGKLELPEFTLAKVFPDDGTVDVKDLSPAAQGVFVDSGFDLPDNQVLDNRLAIGARLELDSLGDQVRTAFGYAPGSDANLLGVLGFDWGDLAGDEVFDLTSVELTATLPTLVGGDQTLLPSWLTLTDADLTVTWDEPLLEEGVGSLTVGAEVTATADVPDSSKPSGSVPLTFDLAAQLTVDDAPGTPAANVDVTFAFCGATTGSTHCGTDAPPAPGTQPDPAWPDVLGIEWLDLTSVGVEIVAIAPASGDSSFEAALVSSFEIGGKTFGLRIGLDASFDGTSAEVVLTLEDQITLSEVLEVIAGPGLALPTDILELGLGPVTSGEDPVRVTARVATEGVFLAVNAPASVSIAGGAPLRTNLLATLTTDGSDVEVVVGARTTGGSTLSDLLGGVLGPDFFSGDLAAFDLTLPSVGLVVSSEPISSPGSSLSPEERAFFGPLYGCASPVPDTCAFEVELAAGVHVLSSVSPPREPGGAPAFGDVMEMFWLDPESTSLLLRGSVPFPASGAIDFEGIQLALVLPINPDAEVRPDWFHSANLAIEFGVTAGEVSFALGGDLDIRVQVLDPTTRTTVSEAECERAWLPVRLGQPERACYQILSLEVGAEVSLSATPKLTIEGIAEAVGGNWVDPFGLTWLEFGAVSAVLEFRLEASTLNISVGFLVSGALKLEPDFGKDLAAGVALNLRVLNPLAPPWVVPEFRGIRLASQAGIELADLERLYDILREEAARLAGAWPSLQPLADLPQLAFDPSVVPNISIRGLDLMVGLGDFPTVCITPGFALSGELYVNAAPLTEIPDALTPGTCGENAPPPSPDDIACLTAAEPCFATVSVDVGPAGLALQGGMGPYALGPLSFEEALFQLLVTPSSQRFSISGGAAIDGLAGGELDITVQPTEVVFAGDVELFPGATGSDDTPAFRALLEGRAGLTQDLTQIDFTDPSSLGGFEVHAVLQADFEAMLREVVGGPLRALRDGVATFDAVYQQLKDTDGDVVAALLDLPDTLRSVGVEVPLWLEDPAGYDLLEAVGDTIDAFAALGLQAPTIQQVFAGATVPVPEPLQVEGVFVFDTCWALFPVFTGTVIDGTCWAVPPVVDVPGLGDLGLGIPADYSDFLEELVEPLLDELLVALGAPAGTTFTGLVDALVTGVDGAVPPLRVECADFRLDSSQVGSSGPKVELRVRGQVFDLPVAFALDWDFGADPLAQAQGVLEDVLAALDGTASVQCEEFGVLGGLVAGPDAVPTLTGFELQVGPAAVDEGGDVTVTAVYDGPVDPATPATVDWGDGRGPQATTAGAVGAGLTHTYRDDDPTGTSSDTATVVVSIQGLTETAVVDVRNVVPTDVRVRLTPGAVDEGSEVELTASFVDPGLDDVHTVEVRWGDGQRERRTLPVGERTIVLTHTYADDAPSGTPNDTYRVLVTVVDDDGGRGAGSANVTVANVRPSEVALVPVGLAEDDRVVPCAPAPCPVREGDTVAFAVSFTDPGTRDTHRVSIGWGDGTTSTVQARPGAQTIVVHRYVDDDPTDTASDVYDVVVRVADDDEPRTPAVATVPITVENVDPVLVDVEVSPSTLDEGPEAVVTVRGRVTDAGDRDTHTVTVDWGYLGFDDTIVELTPADRTFEVTRVYGDDGAFPVTVSVVDDDTGRASVGPVTVIVANVDPTAEIDETGTVATAGGPTFIVRALELLTLGVDADDPGSDDLTLTWDWDTRPAPEEIDAATYQVISLVAPPDLDPDPSPEVAPRQLREEATHAYGQACLYRPSVTVADDDDGTAVDDVAVVVTGLADQVRSPGYWSAQYEPGQRNRNDLDDLTLDCYLEVVGHLSEVFGTGGFPDLADHESARDVLDVEGTGDAGELLDRQILAAWLNLANGSLRWDQRVDTDGDRVGDAVFSELMAGAEALRIGGAPRDELLAAKDRLDRVNNSR